MAARLMQGYRGGLTLDAIRDLPGPVAHLLFLELPRLEARAALMDLQIAYAPHYSGTKQDKNAGDRARRQLEQRLRAQAFGPSRELNAKGQRVINSPEEMRSWLREWGIEG